MRRLRRCRTVLLARTATCYARSARGNSQPRAGPSASSNTHTGTLITTGLKTEWILLKSLPRVPIPVHCPACGQMHKWVPQDASIDPTRLAPRCDPPGSFSSRVNPRCGETSGARARSAVRIYQPTTNSLWRRDKLVRFSRRASALRARQDGRHERGRCDIACRATSTVRFDFKAREESSKF